MRLSIPSTPQSQVLPVLQDTLYITPTQDGSSVLLQTYVGIITVLDGVMSLQGPGPRVLAGGGSHGIAQPIVVRHLHCLAGGAPVHRVPYDGLFKVRQDTERTG